MARVQVNNVLADLDKTMVNLREAMKGLPVRTAGFRAEHDGLAKAVSTLAVDIADTAALLD